jgi:hypothetical protein
MFVIMFMLEEETYKQMIEWWGSLGLVTYQLSRGGDKLPIVKRW